MDIVERLRKLVILDEVRSDNSLGREAADEIERLREALKTFADNVRKTNSGIDENWAKTIYPLKAENQRLREALRQMVNEKCDYMTINHLGDPEKQHTIKLAREALKEGE